MSNFTSCLSRWFRKLIPVTPVRQRNTRSQVETLEARALLASMASATKLTYQDIDGDNVEVTFSKSILTAGNVNTIFTFDTGSVNGSNSTKQQLKSINLMGVAGAALTTITTKAVRSVANGGDGFAALGQIDATGLDLGNVTIDGDLGRILAGDMTTSTQGLGALVVHSMGRFGTLTGAMNLDSLIQGKLASLKSKSDLREVRLRAEGGVDGKIGSVTIGGSLIGGMANDSGVIRSFGDMGAVIIKGDVQGGSGIASGFVQAGGVISSMTIEGSLIGSSGLDSGEIVSTNGIGALKVIGDVVGGAGNGSGRIVSFGKLASLTIGGSLVGGNGNQSGSIRGQEIGKVVITGNVEGGIGQHTGAVRSNGKLGSVSIVGSLIGGSGFESGTLTSIFDMGAVKINGSIKGGIGDQSGSIISGEDISSVAIGGSLIGGSGDYSGSIRGTNAEITTLNITGSVFGGSAAGTVDLVGSGYIGVARIGTMTLSGSLIAGTDSTTGHFLDNGVIRVTNDIASLTIKGSIIGNSTNAALIIARGQASPSGTTDLAIGKLTVNGRVERAQIAAGVAEIKNADAQIGPVIIGGDWIASNLVAGALAGMDGLYGSSDDIKVTGTGVKNVAPVSSRIVSVVIGGQVIGTSMFIDHFGFVAENIGSFKVKGGTTTFPLTAGNSNDDILLSILYNDTRLNEI